MVKTSDELGLCIQLLSTSTLLQLQGHRKGVTAHTNLVSFFLLSLYRNA